jgi:hypothetical protein
MLLEHALKFTGAQEKLLKGFQQSETEKAKGY